MRRILQACIVMAMAGNVASAQTVTLHLNSPSDGQFVAAGATVNWSISVNVSTGDNAGLALVATDLVQDSLNPVKFNIPPGNAASISPTMAQFSVPQGLCNPGEGGATTGYIGVQRGTAGQKNLKQIGGAQNTFGSAGQSIGLDFNVAGGIGQGGSQLVLSGSFTAPATAGSYTFSLANASANVLTSVSAPPAFSPVVAATVDTSTDGSFTFTVGAPVGTPGDMNCDTHVDGRDVQAFALALVNPSAYTAAYPGCNPLNGDFADDDELNVADISGFVNALLTSN